MTPSATHLVLIPAYNPGILLESTVSAARSNWSPVWVQVDGSTDGSHLGLTAGSTEGLEVDVDPRNCGKGAAVLKGAERALKAGFTHVLVMDADGQHPADRIGEFMASSVLNPSAAICGRPLFGPDAPLVRTLGRKLSVMMVSLETRGKGAEDPLFGFRVYPLEPLIRVLSGTGRGRRYDFDPEVAVRLAWAGVPALNQDAACRYIKREEGGVSHFRYVRDNLRMIVMHFRLIWTLILGKTGAHSA